MLTDCRTVTSVTRCWTGKKIAQVFPKVAQIVKVKTFRFHFRPQSHHTTLAYFWKKICYQQLFKMAQSGHTDCDSKFWTRFPIDQFPTGDNFLVNYLFFQSKKMIPPFIFFSLFIYFDIKRFGILYNSLWTFMAYQHISIE